MAMNKVQLKEFNKIVGDALKREGKKSQLKVGDAREFLKCLREKGKTNPIGLIAVLMYLGIDLSSAVITVATRGLKK